MQNIIDLKRDWEISVTDIHIGLLCISHIGRNWVKSSNIQLYVINTLINIMWYFDVAL